MTQVSRKKIISQASLSGGGDPSLPGRVTNLENNEYKVTYYEIISGASGSLTLPTGATINAGEFGLSGNAILSKIDGSNKPTFESPKTSGGTIVTASLNETTGDWVASGTYTDTDVALIYSIKIKAVDYSNLDYDFIVETVADGSAYIKNLTSDAQTQLNTKVGVIVKDITTSSALTGTTAITLIKSVLIPANSFSVGDICYITNRAIRSTATGSSTNYIYVNTSASLSGATLVGTQSAGSRFYAMERNLFIKSATVSETIDVSTSVSADNPAVQATANSDLNIDWTVDQYIIHAFANQAVGNSTVSSGLIVTKF